MEGSLIVLRRWIIQFIWNNRFSVRSSVYWGGSKVVLDSEMAGRPVWCHLWLCERSVWVGPVAVMLLWPLLVTSICSRLLCRPLSVQMLLKPQLSFSCLKNQCLVEMNINYESSEFFENTNEQTSEVFIAGWQRTITKCCWVFWIV